MKTKNTPTEFFQAAQDAWATDEGSATAETYGWHKESYGQEFADEHLIKNTTHMCKVFEREHDGKNLQADYLQTVSKETGKGFDWLVSKTENLCLD